jgi:hypothetical protein
MSAPVWDQPGRLWSLLEIVKKVEFGKLIDAMSLCFDAGTKWRLQGDTPQLFTADSFQIIFEKVKKLSSAIAETELPLSTASAADLLEEFERAEVLPNGDRRLRGQTLGSIKGHIGFMQSTFGRELEARTVLMLSPSDAALYGRTTPPFGNEVADQFPDTIEDISEARMCLALGRYTACVFHLMRALERAAQVVADKIGATVVDEHGRHLAWGVIAENMKPKIDAMTKGSDDQIRWYRVQQSLVAVNRAWRVPTNHPKQTYTEEEARNVFAATGAFMQELAEII